MGRPLPDNQSRFARCVALRLVELSMCSVSSGTFAQVAKRGGSKLLLSQINFHWCGRETLCRSSAWRARGEWRTAVTSCRVLQYFSSCRADASCHLVLVATPLPRLQGGSPLRENVASSLAYSRSVGAALNWQAMLSPFTAGACFLVCCLVARCRAWSVSRAWGGSYLAPRCSAIASMCRRRHAYHAGSIWRESARRRNGLCCATGSVEEDPGSSLFIFGVGYVATAVALTFLRKGWTVYGTCTDPRKVKSLGEQGVKVSHNGRSCIQSGD